MSNKSIIDYATLTVSSTAVSLADASPAITAAAKGAIISCENDQVRWRADGTAPTSSEGHLLNNDDALDFSNGNWAELLNKIQFIRVTGDAELKITYLRTF